MNRQKKELLKKIEQIEVELDVDIQLGFGVVPPGAHDRMYEEIYRLQEELAHLRHYSTAEEMFYDARGQTPGPDLPFQNEPAPAKKQRKRRHGPER